MNGRKEILYLEGLVTSVTSSCCWFWFWFMAAFGDILITFKVEMKWSILPFTKRKPCEVELRVTTRNRCSSAS